MERSMELSGSPFKVSLHLDNIGDCYIDVNVSVKARDHREWQFQHSLDMQNVYSLDAQKNCFFLTSVTFAKDENDDFEGCEKGDVPHAIRSWYEIAVPHAEKMLREAFEKHSMVAS